MPPAEPILASTLWTAHLTSHQPSTGSPALTESRGKLATGLSNLDTTLVPGLSYGTITCISAETSSGARELTHALLVSHLLASDDNAATVIDSTLSFDIRGLHQRLTDELKLRGEEEGRAMEAMGRLEIMKVFDFVGLTECVSEVRGGLGCGGTNKGGVAILTDEEEMGKVGLKGTISDSENEEDESLSVSSLKQQREYPPPQRPPTRFGGDQSCRILVIDNITQLAAPLLKNNHAQGQALLTSFMRSLSHLTRTYNICTVLLNNTITYATAKEEAPSIFASCVLRPALGKTFTYSLDVHLLVHMVPKTAEDAKATYGGEAQGKQRGAVKMVSVVEVLQDRYEDRVGKWAPFVVDSDGRLRDVV
ncbi:hypothetical protein LTR08_003520 [Meristemomyces frigidus]|nr:hypothetical protein LTR08_003520 [Meristemomyces frigidus]